MKQVLTHVTSLYIKYERLLSSVSLFSGFIFTIFTLTQVDRFIENLFIGIHLLLAATGIVIINIFAKETPRGEVDENVSDQPQTSERPDLHFWMTFLIQFAFGGLFSTFLVFYFRSATLSVAWPFLLLLVVTFLANERLRRHYARLSFQISVLFLAIYSFAIYFVPVLLHRIGADVFLLSTGISIVVLFLFLLVLRYFTGEQFRKSRRILYASIGGIVLIMNILYFTNLIPPIPLSLKDAGVYHQISKNTDGTYVLASEFHRWYEFFYAFEPYHMVEGDPVYVWSAIFSPTELDTDIVHRWQYYDDGDRRWITATIINLRLIGGREDGFRTFSTKSTVFPGSWRVDVETTRGQKIGRVKFEIVDVDSSPVLQMDVK
ncbi:MAG: DUF2914 domain-containing protein [Patescibacteria group bacterium]